MSSCTGICLCTLNLIIYIKKDTEQAKQIEELQKKNEDLAHEKERLLKEIEQIL